MAASELEGQPVHHGLGRPDAAVRGSVDAVRHERGRLQPGRGRRGRRLLPLENFYPGDGYVDAVALDAYDGIGAATSTDAARFSDLRSGLNAGGWTAVTPAAINGQAFRGYGLTWLAAFGKEHGKQISLPEWGLESSGTDGGGDEVAAG